MKEARILTLATALALGSGAAIAQTSSSSTTVTTMPGSSSSTVVTTQGSSASVTTTQGSNATVTGTASGGDQALLGSVVSALASDPTLQGASLQVGVSNGAVTLSGTANDSAQAERARSVAAGIAGDGRVTSSISRR